MGTKKKQQAKKVLTILPGKKGSELGPQAVASSKDSAFTTSIETVTSELIKSSKKGLFNDDDERINGAEYAPTR